MKSSDNVHFEFSEANINGEVTCKTEPRNADISALTFASQTSMSSSVNFTQSSRAMGHASFIYF